MLPGPSRRRHVRAVELVLGRVARCDIKPIALFRRHQEDRANFQHRRDLVGSRPQEIVKVADAGDLAAEGVQFRRSFRSQSRGHNLSSGPRRQIADNDRDSQKEKQRQDIFGVRDSKGVERWNKKEIVGQHAHNGREQRWPQAPSDRGDKYCRQKYQRDALNIDELLQEQADTEGGGDQCRAAEVGLDAKWFDTGMGLNRFWWHGFAVVGRDHVNADLAGFAHELVHDRAMHHLKPPRPTRFADDDLGDVVSGRVGNDLFGDVAARDRDRRRTEPLGEPQKVGDPIALGVGQPLRSRGLDIDRGPRHLHAVGHAPGIADQACGIRRFADADEHSLAGCPGTGNRVRPHMR